MYLWLEHLFSGNYTAKRHRDAKKLQRDLSPCLKTASREVLQEQFNHCMHLRRSGGSVSLCPQGSVEKEL